MSTSTLKKIDFTSGKIVGKIIVFALPMAIATILQMLFNAADIAIVGQFSGENGSIYQGAVGATSSLSHLVINLFVGVGTGAGIVMANAFGAKDEKSQHRIVHSSFALALVSGCIVMVIGMLIARPMLSIMNTPSDVIDYSTTYLIIYFAGAPGMMVYNFLSSLLRGVGETKKPLFYLFVSGILNVIANVITVVFLKMNVAGVAIATTLAQYVSAILVTKDMLKADGGMKLSFKNVRLYKKEVRNILFMGVPMGLSACCFSISNILIQSNINTFGADAIAGNSNAGNIEVILDTFAVAVANTIATAVGQNMGAKKVDRIGKVVLIGGSMCLSLQIVSSLTVLIFGKYLAMIYSSDPSVIEWSLKRMKTVGCFMFLISLMHVFGSGLKGMGDSIIPLVSNILFTCVVRVLYMLFVYPYLPNTFELIQITYPITWFLSGVVQMIMYFVRKNKIIKTMKNHEVEQTESENVA